MVAKVSAGILLHRKREGSLQVLLVHLGGPFWARKDDGAWFIPKGEIEPGEDPLIAAKREFAEELGSEVPEGELVPLGSAKNKSGKLIHAFSIEGDLDVTRVRSNTFSIEWPPRSGKLAEFPEVDRAAFFEMETALTKVSPAERVFLERLTQGPARP